MYDHNLYTKPNKFQIYRHLHAKFKLVVGVVKLNFPKIDFIFEINASNQNQSKYFENRRKVTILININNKK